MTAMLNPRSVAVGDQVPGFIRHFGATELMAYGAATWDWHRMHYDLELAQARGLPKPIIDGQVYGAMFARQAIDWAGPRGFIARLTMRMRSMAFAGDELRCEGEVTAVETAPELHIFTLAQRLMNGERVTAEATTILRLPR